MQVLKCNKNVQVWKPKATWNVSLGQLVLTLAADTESYKIYTIRINLENPPSGQPSPSPVLLYARSRGGGGQEQDLLPVEVMDVPGDQYSPFVIAGFKDKSIAQSSTQCNATNQISVTLVVFICETCASHLTISLYQDMKRVI